MTALTLVKGAGHPFYTSRSVYSTWRQFFFASGGALPNLRKTYSEEAIVVILCRILRPDHIRKWHGEINLCLFVKYLVVEAW